MCTVAPAEHKPTKSPGFCHNCGSPVPHSHFGEANPQPPPTSETEQEQQRLIEKLLSEKDRNPHQCHQCGRKEKLHAWDFGLGKIIAEKRAWGATAASVRSFGY